MSTIRTARVSIACDYEDCKETITQDLEELGGSAPILNGGWVRWRIAVRFGAWYQMGCTFDMCPKHSSTGIRELLVSNTATSESFRYERVAPATPVKP